MQPGLCVLAYHVGSPLLQEQRACIDNVVTGLHVARVRRRPGQITTMPANDMIRLTHNGASRGVLLS